MSTPPTNGTPAQLVPAASSPAAALYAEYLMAGLRLVPIPRGMKGPRTPGWQLESGALRWPANVANLAAYNVGLAHLWSGTCALDVDNLEASTLWLAERGVDLQALLQAADAVQICSGREGRAKLLYRLPDAFDWLPTHKNDSIGLEFRCATKEGKSTVQDVLPPSIHPDTGQPYRWGGAGDWRQLPTLPDILLKVWMELEAQRNAGLSKAASTAAGEGTDRAVSSVPATVSVIPEGSRNNTLASLAGTMRRRGMDGVAIEAALLAQNVAACNPPLPDAEVQAIARSIVRYEPDSSAMRDWPTPQPLDRGQGYSEPYPLEALPGIIGAAVEEYQAFGQQPMGLVASSALSVVSLATQGLADIERGPNLRGPISLNFMVVAQSGERKTAADRAMGAALVDWERINADLMEDTIAHSKAAIESWGAKVEGLKAAIKSSMRKHADDVAGLEAQLADLTLARPKELAAPRLRYEDVNPQSLASSLATGHPSAALWSDEGGLVTGSHGMGKDSFLGFLAMLNRLWDGGSVRHDRKQAASVHVEGRRLTVSLMLQPAVLGELLHRSGGLSRGSGFLARFLVAAPASTMGTRLYRVPAAGNPRMKMFQMQVCALLNQPLPKDDNGRLQPQVLMLSPGAFEVWRGYHDAVEKQLVPLGDYRTVCDFAAKAAENAARIAGCLHVFLGRQGAVSTDVMDQGAALAHWYLREALRLMDLLDEPQSWVDARLLDSWLGSQGDCPARDVLRTGPGQLRDKARRNAAIKVLEELGRARIEVHEGRDMLVRNPDLY